MLLTVRVQAACIHRFGGTVVQSSFADEKNDFADVCRWLTNFKKAPV